MHLRSGWNRSTRDLMGFHSAVSHIVPCTAKLPPMLMLVLLGRHACWPVEYPRGLASFGPSAT